MVGGHGRRDGDSPGEIVQDWRAVGVMLEHNDSMKKREWGGGREENTEIPVIKISRIS